MKEEAKDEGVHAGGTRLFGLLRRARRSVRSTLPFRAAGDRDHRPERLWQASFLRAINRMNDLIPGWASGSGAAGELLFDGENVYGPEVDAAVPRRRVGMVFQSPIRLKSIYDNVAYGLAPTRPLCAKRPIRSLRSLVSAVVDEVKRSPAYECAGLSGGQAQRLLSGARIGGKPRDSADGRATSALIPRYGPH